MDRCRECGALLFGADDNFCSEQCEAEFHDGEPFESEFDESPMYDGDNDIEQGRYDDDPSPYDGTYSEE